MTKPTKGPDIARLVDSLVSETLEVDDDEILSAAAETFGDAAQSAAVVRGLLEAAVAKGGRDKLEAARRSLAAGPPVVRLALATMGPAEKRALMARAIEERKNRVPVTLAARHGKDVGDEEVAATLDALVTLGVIDGNGNIL